MRKVLSILFTLVLMASLVPQQTQAANVDFKDVPKSHTNYTEIMYLLEMGVIEQTEKFGVNDKVTREEVAIMVAKAIGLDGQKTKTKFKDVPESRYSSGYINSAVNAGIINGYPDGTFKPKSLVTRGHMAAFIANAFKLTNQADIKFKDVSKESTSYIAVRKLVYANITSGYPDSTFKPNEGLTRAHISAFIARAMNPAFRPKPKSVSKPVPSFMHGVNLNMNVSQVQKVESAKLLRKLGDGKNDYLIYETNRFGYPNQLVYNFENGKLIQIYYEFFPDKNSFDSEYEMGIIYNNLHVAAVKELGTDYTYANSKRPFGTVWDKDPYSIHLLVGDRNLYTTATISLMK
ncbi:S-layer homology domain-containing protein [Sporosarcina sp. FSL K6-1540]|uniref:S-layer homology domain-containing protein n=1 Tax=Sporosarcina sp. FSL K6-1540 TaxID=2921555 RepID=UPI003159BEFD